MRSNCMADEIRVPKGVREFMPDWIQETALGEPQGELRQYRHGLLHIREYDDEFRVHVDKVDPRRDPLGHLICDAPEVLVGLAAATLVGGLYAAKPGKKSRRGYGTAAATAAASGYVSYALTKKFVRKISDESRCR